MKCFLSSRFSSVSVELLVLLGGSDAGRKIVGACLERTICLRKNGLALLKRGLGSLKLPLSQGKLAQRQKNSSLIFRATLACCKLLPFAEKTGGLLILLLFDCNLSQKGKQPTHLAGGVELRRERAGFFQIAGCLRIAPLSQRDLSVYPEDFDSGFPLVLHREQFPRLVESGLQFLGQRPMLEQIAQCLVTVKQAQRGIGIKLDRFLKQESGMTEIHCFLIVTLFERQTAETAIDLAYTPLVSRNLLAELQGFLEICLCLRIMSSPFCIAPAGDQSIKERIGITHLLGKDQGFLVIGTCLCMPSLQIL